MDELGLSINGSYKECLHSYVLLYGSRGTLIKALVNIINNFTTNLKNQICIIFILLYLFMQLIFDNHH